MGFTNAGHNLGYYSWISEASPNLPDDQEGEGHFHHHHGHHLLLHGPYPYPVLSTHSRPGPQGNSAHGHTNRHVEASVHSHRAEEGAEGVEQGMEDTHAGTGELVRRPAMADEEEEGDGLHPGDTAADMPGG